MKRFFEKLESYWVAAAFAEEGVYDQLAVDTANNTIYTEPTTVQTARECA